MYCKIQTKRAKAVLTFEATRHDNDQRHDNGTPTNIERRRPDAGYIT